MLHINSSFEKNFTEYPLNNTGHSKEKIETIYHRDYLFNLANIITDKRIQACWHGIEDLVPYHRKALKEFTTRQGDNYLKDATDKTLLAKDILVNGTYWSLVIGNDVNNNMVVYKGAHRIISAKLLDKSGGWDNRKFLCLKFEGKFIADYREFYYGDVPLDNPTKQHVPIEMIYQGGDNKLIEEHMARNNIKRIDDIMMEVELHDYKSLIRAFNFLPIWLRNPMFIHKDIKPNEVINNMEEFNKWLGE